MSSLQSWAAVEEGVSVVVAARQLGSVDAAVVGVVVAVGGVGHRGELGRDALARQSVVGHVHLEHVVAQVRKALNNMDKCR